tara:strand:+ start:307 stop:435 length:129 start_codon:yes stop_codon:yes gene_type:complete
MMKSITSSKPQNQAFIEGSRMEPLLASSESSILLTKNNFAMS